MNPKIKELADQAEDYADGIVDQGGEFHEAYTKKLAELIIRECIGQCLFAGDNTAEHAAENIVEHFGVE